jgi:hypothetical protein
MGASPSIGTVPVATAQQSFTLGGYLECRHRAIGG